MEHQRMKRVQLRRECRGRGRSRVGAGAAPEVVDVADDNVGVFQLAPGLRTCGEAKVKVKVEGAVSRRDGAGGMRRKNRRRTD